MAAFYITLDVLRTNVVADYKKYPLLFAFKCIKINFKSKLT